jgi:hypothetical protein
MQRCIVAGAEAGAPRLYLETNSTLGPALGLYRTMGFVDTGPPPHNDYARGDTWMERRY